jgi:TonB family protein
MKGPRRKNNPRHPLWLSKVGRFLQRSRLRHQPLTHLGTSDNAVKPKLQTLSVSQGVSQGLLYKKVAPSYPSNALRMHIEGEVQLMATISKEGDITRIKVLSGDAQLAKAATDAVKQWKYKPYLLNGEPVEIQTQVTVNFKMPH